MLIDEYQDTNGSQYRIVKALGRAGIGTCASWETTINRSMAGAAPRSPISCGSRLDWPEAKVVRLEDNYRSTAEILDAGQSADRPQPHAARQGAAPGDVGRSAAEDSAMPGRRRRGEASRERYQGPAAAAGNPAARFRDPLCARTSNAGPFEMELRRAGVPYVVLGGMSFYDRREVRDILSYLKLLVSPADEVALLRIINRPARGIGQATVTALVEQAVKVGKPVWELFKPEQRPAEVRVNAATNEAIRKFQLLVERYRQRAAQSHWWTIARDLIRDIGYREEIDRAYENPAERLSRWSAVEEVVNSLGRYQQRAEAADAARVSRRSLVGRSRRQTIRNRNWPATRWR